MDGEKPTNQASVKLLVVPVFPASGYFNLAARDAGAVQHDLAQHGGHGAGGAGADHVLDVRDIFFERAAFVIGYFGDVARRDVNAVVGKDAEGGSLLDGRYFDRAQRHRQIGRDVRSDAEAVG